MFNVTQFADNPYENKNIMQISIQQLKQTAKDRSIISGIPYKKEKKILISETHFALTAIGIPRHTNGQKLGLQKRFHLAKDEIARRFS